MILQLPGFPDGGNMPRKYSCQGDEVSPELIWMDLPEEIKSLVLFMYDVSIPADWLRLTTIDHWVVYNIPTNLRGLPENVPDEQRLENGALQGKRLRNKTGYMGPCPLFGTHLYVFELYALNKMLEMEPENATRTKLTHTMKTKIIDKTVYAGKYRKTNR
ncbi:YbhB/YbcL family Raf kinase inhibitor-like protein [Candidatus Bathyarchaeota archaeon]|nr:YbhB/YbcL family Raf kinase inhibitor-like protein [Candidatus Bathyarchaeota archaeon]